MSEINPLPVAIIGAGPVGLAAAAHLAERQMPFRIYEAGPGIAENVRQWAHVQLFSPWRYNVDGVAARLLDRHGWRVPDPAELPTGRALRDRYLAPLAAAPEIARHLQTGSRVQAVSRSGIDKVRSPGREAAPFEIRLTDPQGAVRRVLAAAVIDASGTWQNPNPLGANGPPALGEVPGMPGLAYGIPDVAGAGRVRYAGRRVLVVGAGHSAANLLLALAGLAADAPDTRIAWAVRGRNLQRLFGGGRADQLEARGALGAALKALYDAGRLEVTQGLAIDTVERGPNGLIVAGVADGGRIHLGPFDEIVAATGQRPDPDMTRELRLDLDPWLESSRSLGPMIDPNLHSCGTVPPHGFAELAHPEPDYFAVGVKSYGRAPTFLMATGYEQVRSVVAALAGDMAAAGDVRLVLPQTGVCSSTAGPVAAGPVAAGPVAAGPVAAGPASPMAAVADADPSGCCGGPDPRDTDACCVADATARAAGLGGCGCGRAA